jgi:hypothetical protein
MIASYRYNFIFIKTKKTGGTTIEMTLAPACGPEDIITPIGSREELRRGNGRPLCRNFSSAPALEEKLRSAMIVGDKQARAVAEEEIAPHGKFGNHINAQKIKERLAPEFWSGAHKFSIERHPYEKAVSFAYFTYKPRIAKSGRSFDEHLDSVVRRSDYSGYHFYSIDGEVAVDEFLRCENLERDLRRLAEKLGIPIPDTLTTSKQSSRKDRRPAREILTDVQKEIIHRRCKREFDLFAHEL